MSFLKEPKGPYGSMRWAALPASITRCLKIKILNLSPCRDVSRNKLLHHGQRDDVVCFGIMDSIGLDTVFKVTDYRAKMRNDEEEKKNAAFLKNMLRKKRQR